MGGVVGCRGLEITGGESSEGRGQRGGGGTGVGGNVALWAFFHLFALIFLLLF